MLGGISIRCCAVVSACKAGIGKGEGEGKGESVKGEGRMDKGTKQLEGGRAL